MLSISTLGTQFVELYTQFSFPYQPLVYVQWVKSPLDQIETSYLFWELLSFSQNIEHGSPNYLCLWLSQVLIMTFNHLPFVALTSQKAIAWQNHGFILSWHFSRHAGMIRLLFIFAQETFSFYFMLNEDSYGVMISDYGYNQFLFVSVFPIYSLLELVFSQGLELCLSMNSCCEYKFEAQLSLSLVSWKSKPLLSC